MYPLGSPSKQLSQPARGCFWPLVNLWDPWHTLCLSALAVEGDNQGIHAIPGRNKLSTRPLQHFIAGLRKAACPDPLCRAGGLNSLLPKGGISPPVSPIADGISSCWSNLLPLCLSSPRPGSSSLSLWQGAPWAACVQAHPSARNRTNRVCNRAQPAAF